MMNSPRNTARASSVSRALALSLLLATLVGCASSGSQPVVDQASVLEAQRAADAAEAQRAAQDRARMESAEAERLRQEALAQAEAAQERREVQAREQAQRDRIAALEAQIAELRDSNSRVTAANSKLDQAIATAEELLEALNEEQLKYGNTDAAGQPVQALEKDLIADLEARKDSLKQEAQALVNQ